MMLRNRGKTSVDRGDRPELWKLLADRIADIIIGIVIAGAAIAYMYVHGGWRIWR